MTPMTAIKTSLVEKKKKQITVNTCSAGNGWGDTLHCAKDKSIQLTDYLTQKYSHIPLDLPFLILPLVSKSLSG